MTEFSTAFLGKKQCRPFIARLAGDGVAEFAFMFVHSSDARVAGGLHSAAVSHKMRVIPSFDVLVCLPDVRSGAIAWRIFVMIEVIGHGR